jgi:hypothetical protein
LDDRPARRIGQSVEHRIERHTAVMVRIKKAAPLASTSSRRRA